MLESQFSLETWRGGRDVFAKSASYNYVISHIRNRCIQSERRDGESSALPCHTQPDNSGWLDPSPVICFLSPGLSLCKIQMTFNFFMNLWGRSKPVSHPCGPNFCYCCSIHELDVLIQLLHPSEIAPLVNCAPPRLWSVFYIQEGINDTKHPGQNDCVLICSAARESLDAVDRSEAIEREKRSSCVVRMLTCMKRGMRQEDFLQAF